LKGVPVYSGDVKSELVTPTGALVLTTHASSYGPMPQMAVDRIGYGAGTKDFASHPNVLRVIIGERTGERVGGEVDGGAGDVVVKIECEIDDMNPQLWGPALDRIMAAGALDAYLTPIQMKKGRPGTLLTVLGRPAARAALCDLIFRNTTTLGVRFETMARETLDRRFEDVAVPGGTVRVKVAERHGHVLNAAPEFDDCARLAVETTQPVKEVQAAAMRAWLARAEKGQA
jgi:hypothetical protein